MFPAFSASPFATFTTAATLPRAKRSIIQASPLLATTARSCGSHWTQRCRSLRRMTPDGRTAVLVPPRLGAKGILTLIDAEGRASRVTLRLPDTDGVDLLRRLREVLPGVPTFITTAYVSMEPRLRVLDLPFEGYLVKPFELRDLGDRIDALA